MLWTMMFKMDCGGRRARETAFAVLVSDDKYFPLRTGLQQTTSQQPVNTVDDAIL
jgi:hypothetical protein